MRSLTFWQRPQTGRSPVQRFFLSRQRRQADPRLSGAFPLGFADDGPASGLASSGRAWIGPPLGYIGVTLRLLVGRAMDAEAEAGGRLLRAGAMLMRLSWREEGSVGAEGGACLAATSATARRAGGERLAG